MPARIADEQIDRALDRVRAGVSFEQAAASIGVSARTVREHCYRRGIDPKSLRPPITDYKRRTHYDTHHGRDYPCRYCDGPVSKLDGVCGRLACRTRWLAEQPPELRLQRLRKIAHKDDRRREDGTPACNDAAGRHDVHLQLTTDEHDALRAEAARRHMSMSRLLVTVLKESGLLSPGDVRRDTIALDYLRGKTARHIAQARGLLVQHVYRALQESGMQEARLHAPPAQGLRDAYESGIKVAALATRYAVSEHTVRQWLKAAGVTLTRRKRLSLSDTEIAERYRAGATLAELASATSVNSHIIRYRLVRMGVQLRPGGVRASMPAPAMLVGGDA